MSSGSKWSIKKLRDRVQATFTKRPCLWQIRVAQSLREKKNDVVLVAATGSGKTLSFWMPLLMALEEGEDKFIIIITPLNVLGKQNVEILAKAGISGVAIDSSNNTDETFKDVEAIRHRVVVVNPEIIMDQNGHFEKLWRKPEFTSKLLYVVFDEAHCVSEWSSFRSQYKHIGSIRYMIPDTVPFLVASATLAAPVLADVVEILQLRISHIDYILRSNDRQDIHLTVRRMLHPACSFNDLNFLIPDEFKDGGAPPPKFLVFFDSIKEAEDAVKHLRNRLPGGVRGKIKYFHSVMTPHYRTAEYEALRDDQIWGLCVTDSFGMGLDIPDIKVVVQWKATCNITTLWQRLGRAARGYGQEGIGIILVPPNLFDSERDKAKQRSEKRQEKAQGKKRKRKHNKTDPP
ncbi:P-loop containing nucleoside triphosphate hydrolase protein, partial [Gloeophyllum trabeum ATCC 11539]